MRLILIDGIPHWTDGDLTLPVIAGAQDCPPGYIKDPASGQCVIDWSLHGGGGGGEEAQLGPETWVGQNIFDPNTGEYLGRIYSAEPGPGNEGQWGGGLRLHSPTGASPRFHAGTYLTETGILVALDDAARIVQSRTLPLGSGSDGSDRGPTVTGAAQPDPLGAAGLLLDYYEQQVAQGIIPYNTALQEFTSNLDRARAVNDDIRERQIAESSRQLRLAEEAGSRARTVAQDILPRSLPGVQNISLPLIGNVPLNQVNVDQLFNQGLPPLAQMPGIPQTPTEAYPGMLDLPQLNLPPLPNIDQYVQQAAQGFPGFLVG